MGTGYKNNGTSEHWSWTLAAQQNETTNDDKNTSERLEFADKSTTGWPSLSRDKRHQSKQACHYLSKKTSEKGSNKNTNK